MNQTADVLVVDDDPGARSTFEALLAAHGPYDYVANLASDSPETVPKPWNRWRPRPRT
ncbi:MAG: hypothetical protein ACLFTV_00315 [Desulfococcaceae bacterium]